MLNVECKSSLYYSTAVIFSLNHASEVSICHLENIIFVTKFCSAIWVYDPYVLISCFVFSSESASSPALFTTKYYWITLYTPVTVLTTEMSDMHRYLTDRGQL